MVPSSVFDYTNVDLNTCMCTFFSRACFFGVTKHYTGRYRVSWTVTISQKILTYYNRNVAENDKVSSEKILDRGVHKVKVDFSQCTDQLIRSNNIPQTLYPVAVYQLHQKSAGAKWRSNQPNVLVEVSRTFWERCVAELMNNLLELLWKVIRSRHTTNSSYT